MIKGKCHLYCSVAYKEHSCTSSIGLKLHTLLRKLESIWLPVLQNTEIRGSWLAQGHTLGSEKANTKPMFYDAERSVLCPWCGKSMCVCARVHAHGGMWGKRERLILSPTSPTPAKSSSLLAPPSSPVPRQHSHLSESRHSGSPQTGSLWWGA